VIHRRDGVELHVDLSGAVTVGDVLDRINNHADNTPNAAQVVARTASFGNAIELVDVDPTGAGTLQVERTTFSQAAEDLGFVAVGANVSLDAQAPQPSTATVSLAGANNDLTFTASQAGTSLDGVSIQFINSAASGNTAIVNYDAGAKTLTIDVDPAATTAATILAQVNAEGTFSAQLSTAADAGNDGSGLVTETGTVATTAGGTDDVLSSGDINPLETAGVFNTLIRLADALTAGDERAVERGIAQLDNDLTRLNFARAEIGARGQVLDVMQVRVDTDVIELKEVLSLEIDVDLVEAISALTARQASFQASLQTAARSFQLSLLDFL
jgi:flagellin-like hook-associated protein FlgL